MQKNPICFLLQWHLEPSHLYTLKMLVCECHFDGLRQKGSICFFIQWHLERSGFSPAMISFIIMSNHIIDTGTTCLCILPPHNTLNCYTSSTSTQLLPCKLVIKGERLMSIRCQFGIKIIRQTLLITKTTVLLMFCMCHLKFI